MTTVFHRECCNGKHYAEAVLIVRQAGEPGPGFVRIDFRDMVIKSVSTGGSEGEDRLTENVTLNFSEFKTEYQPQMPEGAPPVGYDWNKTRKKDKP